MDYYDTEWGVPIRDERGLYERICLEGFQAGLSWATILRKRPDFRAAFADFDPDVVATYSERRRAAARRRRHHPAPRQDPGDDHQRAGHDRATGGGGPRRLRLGLPTLRHPPSKRLRRGADGLRRVKALSKALRKKGFAFVGPTTMYALMEAVGIVDTHLMTSHRRGSSGVWPD